MRLTPMKKSALETLDFDIDFSNWLVTGDRITDASVVIDSVIGCPTASNVEINNPTVKVWIAGGETFKNYDIKTIVTTQSGRIVEAVFNLRVVGF